MRLTRFNIIALCLLCNALLIAMEIKFNSAIVFSALIVFNIVWITCVYLTREKPKASYTIASKAHTPETHIAIWDRTTVDIPSPQYLQKFKFEALYFFTSIGEKPDLTLIRTASKVNTINHWEYKTDVANHFKIYALYSLLHIQTIYGQNVNIHVFTNDEELVIRFKIQAKAYGFQKLNFKNSELVG